MLERRNEQSAATGTELWPGAQPEIAVASTSEQASDEAIALTEEAAKESEDLAQLVHGIVTLEDRILGACEKTEVLLDWVAKGGHSLGLD